MLRYSDQLYEWPLAYYITYVVHWCDYTTTNYIGVHGGELGIGLGDIEVMNCDYCNNDITIIPPHWNAVQ